VKIAFVGGESTPLLFLFLITKAKFDVLSSSCQKMECKVKLVHHRGAGQNRKNKAQGEKSWDLLAWCCP
jgi:hypothetical protein